MGYPGYDTRTCACGEPVVGFGRRCEDCEDAYEAAMDAKGDQMREEWDEIDRADGGVQ